MMRRGIANLAILILPLGILLVGCSLNGARNYTPSTIPARATQLYPFEVSWNSAKRGVNPDDVEAFVMIDQVLYPMSKVPVAKDRWEAKVPLPEGRMIVPYKFKFDYTFPGIRRNHTNSLWTPEYRLVIPH